MQYNKNTYCSQALIWSIFAVSKERALVMIPSESPSQRQTTEAATRKQHDRFLYQRRVSEKISACVGGSLSDEEIALLPLYADCFPGTAYVVDRTKPLRPGPNYSNLERGIKASIKSSAG